MRVFDHLGALFLHELGPESGTLGKAFHIVLVSEGRRASDLDAPNAPGPLTTTLSWPSSPPSPRPGESGHNACCGLSNQQEVEVKWQDLPETCWSSPLHVCRGVEFNCGLRELKILILPQRAFRLSPYLFNLVSLPLLVATIFGHIADEFRNLLSSFCRD